MRRWPALILVSLAIVSTPPSASGRLRPAVHTKTQAEVNVLRVVARNWKSWRKFGLVDPRTHLLADNTEAVCQGRGRRHTGASYPRFVCVVRPHAHRGRQGLWLGYRVLSKVRFKVRILAYYGR
jgi:hypothetical protein